MTTQLETLKQEPFSNQNIDQCEQFLPLAEIYNQEVKEIIKTYIYGKFDIIDETEVVIKKNAVEMNNLVQSLGKKNFCEKHLTRITNAVTDNDNFGMNFERCVEYLKKVGDVFFTIIRLVN